MKNDKITHHALIVIAAAGLATCPLYAGLNEKLAISALHTQSCYIVRFHRKGKRKNVTHARTAFISMIAIVFPIHACGPAMKDRNEKTGWSSLGGESQRFGLNLRTWDTERQYLILRKDETTRRRTLQRPRPKHLSTY
jgi:hypothetical protein